MGQAIRRGGETSETNTRVKRPQKVNRSEGENKEEDGETEMRNRIRAWGRREERRRTDGED